MCGRFVVTASRYDIAQRFDVDTIDAPEAGPNYNVTPRARVLVIRQREAERVLSPLRWGLVPSWAKSPAIGDRMINARAESVVDTHTYERAFARRRCIVPIDGFYEWQAVGPPGTTKGRVAKMPVYVQARSGRTLAVAGLWEIWKVPEGAAVDGVDDGWLRTFTIITTRANDLLAPVHDRMPVVLAEGAWRAWLDRSTEVGALEAMLAPPPVEDFELWPVSTAVNSPDNNSPQLLTPV